LARLLAGTTHRVTWVIEDLDSYIAEKLRSLIYKSSGLKEASSTRRWTVSTSLWKVGAAGGNANVLAVA